MATDYNLFKLNCHHFAIDAMAALEQEGWTDSARDGTLFDARAFERFMRTATRRVEGELSHIKKAYDACHRQPTNSKPQQPNPGREVHIFSTFSPILVRILKLTASL